MLITPVLTPVSATELLTSLLATWVLVALYRSDPTPALRFWAASFGLQAATTLLVAHRHVGPELPWAVALGGATAALGAVCMVWGTLRYLGKGTPRAWLVLPAGVIAFSIVATAVEMPFLYRAVPAALALGGSLVFLGFSVARSWARSVGARVAGVALIAYGLHVCDYPLTEVYPSFLSWGHALAAFLQMAICVGFVLLHFERARDRLSDEERRYSALFENAVAGIFRADATGTVIAANATLERLVGTGHSLVGTDVRALFETPEEAAEVLAAEPAHLTAHAVRWKSVSGPAVDVQVYVRRVMSAHGVSAVEGVVVDVTRMANLERHLDQVQRAEVLGQLAGGIAHDINNVLTVVLGNTERLRASVGAEPRLLGMVAGIADATEQGAALTRQLLTFSRRHPATRQTFELGPRVERAVRMLKPTLGERVDLSLEISPTAGAVRADPALLEQVVVNLVLNARDSLPAQGGRIGVSVRDAAEVNGAAPAVLLEVSDTGSGMDQATLQRAFEPFFTTKTQGTGLGLAVVQRVVNQADGALTVDSTPGQGTTFRARFPRVTPVAEQSIAVGPEQRLGGPKARVLLVDDRADVRRVLSMGLSLEGFEVLAPESSTDAVAQLDSGLLVDLLITDVRMPQVSGPEVARALWARAPECPVIFVSGYTDESQLPGIQDRERTRFLSKPFQMDRLVSAARELVSLARARRDRSALQTAPA